MIPGQKVLVLRYGNNIKLDCIEEHQKLIDKLGYCWFGKIGTCPSVKVINAVMNQDNPEVILYAISNIYICKLEEITYEKPKEGYPEYYEQDLFAWSIYPKIYFKLTSIKKIHFDELKNLIVCSSHSQLQETLYRSMASFFLAELPDYNSGCNSSVKTNKSKADKKSNDKQLLGKNDCIYRKDGKCNCKSCVNYKYECERPSMCLKQKR